jgi:hypothetical protein
LFLISSSFHTYFIYNFSSKRRHLLDQSKFRANLNLFEIKFIRFDSVRKPNWTHCATGPCVGTVSRSPRTPSLPAGPHGQSTPLVSHARPRRARRGWVAAARRRAAALSYTAPGPSLSPAPPHKSLDFPDPPPFKRALPPTVDRIFFPPLTPCFRPALTPRPPPPPSPPPLATGPP